jgi:hypothetical protein
MNLHIYTVKWGTKYPSSHVNEIFKQCVKFVERNFNFYCITEDPTGLDPSIVVLKIPENNYYEKWWNKLYLFDTNVVWQEGEKIFLDLDIVVQRNLNAFIEHPCEDKLLFVKTEWHDLEKMKKDTEHVPHKYTNLNSSVLRWNDRLIESEEMKRFNKMIGDYPSQMFFYFRGLDNLFYNKFSHEHMGYFPSGWVYSYNYGYQYPNDVEEFKYRETPFICLYDSMERPEDVKIELSD